MTDKFTGKLELPFACGYVQRSCAILGTSTNMINNESLKILRILIKITAPFLFFSFLFFFFMACDLFF